MTIKLNHIALAAAISMASSASMAVSIDLTNAGSNGGGFGNSVTFTEGDLSVTATAWGLTGTVGGFFGIGGTPVLETAEVYSWDTGLGVCNQSEGSIAAGSCSTSSSWFSSDEHQLDNAGDDDFVLFVFNQEVNFNSITVDPFNNQDTDVSFAVATISGAVDLTDTEPFSGVFSNEQIKSGPYTTFPQSIGLDGWTGNALLFSASSVSNDDAFKIASIDVTATAVIPVPASAWLFASGVAALVVRKRSAK